MRSPWAWLIVGANAAALVALTFAAPHLMVGPGLVRPAHAAIATQCFACHAPFRGVQASRCIACHTLATIGRRATGALRVAFHGELIEQDCAACHTDHQAPRLTGHEAKAFSHALLRATIRDRCSGCHVPPTNELHRTAGAGCAACHESKRWKPATFDHARFFVLEGDHAAPCVTCHVGEDFKRYTCFGCHEHTLAKVRSEHEEEGIRSFDNCVECHRSSSKRHEE
jgi:hypothetical protein